MVAEGVGDVAAGRGVEGVGGVDDILLVQQVCDIELQAGANLAETKFVARVGGNEGVGAGVAVVERSAVGVADDLFAAEVGTAADGEALESAVAERVRRVDVRRVLDGTVERAALGVAVDGTVDVVDVGRDPRGIGKRGIGGSGLPSGMCVAT